MRCFFIYAYITATIQQFIAKNFNVTLNLIINYIYKHIEKYT